MMLAVVLYLLSQRQPVYQGKPLSVWLKNYDDPITRTSVEWQQTDESMRHIGSRAIPTLLRMMRLRDSNLELKIINLCQRQRFIKISHTPAATLNIEAMFGFKALGANGAVALPELEKIVEQNISGPSRESAAFALGSMGHAADDAVPVLLRCATNSDDSEHFWPFWALRQIHPPPERVVPALTQALYSSNEKVRENAAYLLASYGSEAKCALPALKEITNHVDDLATFFAGYALKQIENPAPTNAVADESPARQ